MRTSCLESKSDRSPPAPWLPVMATRRRPLHRSSEEEEDDEVEVDSESEQTVEDYSGLRRRVARETDLLLRETPVVVPPPDASNVLLVVVVTAVLIGLACVVYLFAFRPAPGAVEHDEAWLRENLTKDMKIVRSKFPSQTKTIWSDFFSGIQKVLLEHPTEPSVFLLLHEGTESTSACIARKVGRVAHDFLNATEPGPLVLEGSSLEGEDSGLLVDTYRLPVERHRIMIVHNLHLVPATIARGFHAFCDTVTPLVRKAVYIFTLDVAGVAGEGGNPTAVAERELYTAWKQLDMDILSPLVVRITSGSVFRIQPEESVNKVC